MSEAETMVDNGVNVEALLGDPRLCGKLGDLKAEITLTAFDSRVFVRLSAHAYNSAQDYQRLAELTRRQFDDLLRQGVIAGAYDVSAYLWLEGVFVFGTLLLGFVFFARSATREL